MPVETFECQETAAEPIEIAEEAIGIMESLGLTGQLSLVRKADSDAPNSFPSRWPYRVMTAEEQFVYRILCPEATKLADYRDGPVPIRVLQIAAHAKSVRPDIHMYVWHRAAPGLKDPVLVAQTRDHWSEWVDGFQRFILARWGEELETFAVLMKRACETKREQLTSEVQRLVHVVRGATDAEIISKGSNMRFSW